MIKPAIADKISFPDTIDFLQTNKNIIKPTNTYIHLHDMEKSFIFDRHVTQVNVLTKKPHNVAKAAPSIPIAGINIQFILILTIAPDKSSRVEGHVFFITKNWLAPI